MRLVGPAKDFSILRPEGPEVSLAADVEGLFVKGRGGKYGFTQIVLVDDAKGVTRFGHGDQPRLRAKVEVVVGNDRGGAVLAESAQAVAIN